MPSLVGLQHSLNRAYDSVELRNFGRELFAAELRDPIVARAAVAAGDAPFRCDPTLDEHALQRGIQRTFLHLQHILRSGLYRVGDFVPVQFAVPGKGLQYQHVERAGRNLIPVWSLVWSWHS